jgi:hypothetical protein
LSRIHITGNDVAGRSHGIIDVIIWYLLQETGEIKKTQIYKPPQVEYINPSLPESKKGLFTPTL